MSEVSREEFRQEVAVLHKKMDEISTVVTRIDTTLKITPIPKQPCPFFNEHVDEHKAISVVITDAKEHMQDHIEITKMLLKAIIATVVGSIGTAMGVTWVFIQKFGESIK